MTFLTLHTGHASNNAYWFVPRGVNPLFTGRGDIGARLDSAMLAGNFQGQRRYVIDGLGGTGKSEVCLQFAYRHRQR